MFVYFSLKISRPPAPNFQNSIERIRPTAGPRSRVCQAVTEPFTDVKADEGELLAEIVVLKY